jgi:O-antigen/teichoic acid export membrane protein
MLTAFTRFITPLHKDLLKRLSEKKIHLLLSNASSIMAMTITTSLLGFIFWWLAAKLYSPEMVGASSALVSSMLLLGSASIFGFGTVLQGELPKQPGNSASLISTFLFVVCVIGAVFGTIAITIFRISSAQLSSLFADSNIQIIFVLGTSISAGGLLVDQASIGLLKGKIQLFRNISHSLLKIIFLGLFSILLIQAVTPAFTAWVISGLITVVTVFLIDLWKRGKIWLGIPNFHLLKQFGALAIVHHLLNLVMQAPAQILPLIVVSFISVKANAFFYTAWMICSFSFVTSSALSSVLYTVGSSEKHLLSEKLNYSLRFAFIAGFCTTLFLLIFSPIILRLFSTDYANAGTESLRLLCLATFPLIIKTHFVAIQRVKGKVGISAVILLVCGIFEILAAMFGARSNGLPGLCLFWTIFVYIEAIGLTYPVWRCLSARKEPN